MIYNVKYRISGSYSYSQGYLQSKNLVFIIGDVLSATSGVYLSADNTNRYLIGGDTTSLGLVGRSCGGGASTASANTPTFWATSDLSQDALVELLNRIPSSPRNLVYATCRDWVDSSNLVIMEPRSFVLKNSMNLYYDFLIEDCIASTASGTPIFDIAGVNGTPDISGTTTYLTGSCYFDGSLSLSVGCGEVVSYLTFNSWIKMYSISTYQCIFANDTDRIYIDSGFIKFTTTYPGGTPISAPLAGYENVWTFITVSFDNLGTCRIYINGVAKASASIGGSLDTGGWYLGSNPTNSENFNGEMGVVIIYGTHHSGSEVLQNYFVTRDRFI